MLAGNGHLSSINLSRETLNRIVLKQTTLKDAIAAGDVKISGV